MPKRFIPSIHDRVQGYSSGDSDLDPPSGDEIVASDPPSYHRSRPRQRQAVNYPRPHSHLFRDRFGGRVRGGRHARRQENSLYLTTLHQIEEEEDDFSINVVPEHNTIFKRLFTSHEDHILWDKFVSLNEEEQEELLSKARKQSKHSKEHIKRDDPLKSLDPHLRKLLLQTKRIPKDFMNDVEDDLRDYFSNDGLGVMVYMDLTSFQRMLVHGICQYNDLTAQRVEVNGDVYLAVSTQNEKSFSPPNQLLHSHLK